MCGWPVYHHKEKALKFTKTKVLITLTLIKVLIIFLYCNRIQTEVNESYNGTFIKQRNLSSQDPYYNTVTTSDEAVRVYDVIDDIN